MKKLILILVVLITASTLNAQSFKNGTNIVEVDLGLALYTKVTNDISFRGFTAQHEGQAVSSVLGLQYERGITNFLGAGLRISKQNYFDSSGNNENTEAGSFDVGLVLNAHFLRAKRVDLYGGVVIGISSLKIDDNNSSARYEGSGAYLDLGLGARFYMGNRFFLSPKLQYSNLKVNGDYVNVFNNEVKGEWNANGVKLSIAAGIKF